MSYQNNNCFYSIRLIYHLTYHKNYFEISFIFFIENLRCIKFVQFRISHRRIGIDSCFKFLKIQINFPIFIYYIWFIYFKTNKQEIQTTFWISLAQMVVLHQHHQWCHLTLVACLVYLLLYSCVFLDIFKGLWGDFSPFQLLFANTN